MKLIIKSWNFLSQVRLILFGIVTYFSFHQIKLVTLPQVKMMDWLINTFEKLHKRWIVKTLEKIRPLRIFKRLALFSYENFLNFDHFIKILGPL